MTLAREGQVTGTVSFASNILPLSSTWLVRYVSDPSCFFTQFLSPTQQGMLQLPHGEVKCFYRKMERKYKKRKCLYVLFCEIVILKIYLEFSFKIFVHINLK